MNNLQLVLGGPGCGKTTRLLHIVERELAAGIPASQVAFVTFNKDASDSSRTRAAAQFGLNAKDDLPWFRTIHSLAYAGLGVQRDEMMSKRDWLEFAGVVNEELTGTVAGAEDAPLGGARTTGDMLLRIVDYARTTCGDLHATWRELDEPVSWFRLKRFADALTGYKEDTGKWDFTDLLCHYPVHGAPVTVQVAVIDEAQDLTAAQWRVVQHAFQGAARVYVAGDDDQAIYQWAGADVARFLTLAETPEVLSMSHRLPERVHALSQRVAARISRRYAKTFQATTRPGEIVWHNTPTSVDLSAGTWFLLARNNYMLREVEEFVREQGVLYSLYDTPAVTPTDVRVMQCWERLRTGKQADMSAMEYRALCKLLERPKPQTKELARYTLAHAGIDPGWAAGHPWYDALPGLTPRKRDYYLACLRRGERLTEPPRIRIDTIHGVKGLEADAVMLLTDLSGRTAASFRDAPDNEHRVFYVGITRAKQALHIVMPQSDQFYPMA